VLNRLPHILVLLAAVVMLSGCAQNNGPTTYTDEVKANYQDNCVKGATDKLGAAGAATYCQCTYDAFVANISFDAFTSFESYLRAHVGGDIKTIDDLDHTNKYDDIIGLLKGCIAQGPSLSGASVSTTIPATTTTR
jgi:hypothetical protein